MNNKMFLCCFVVVFNPGCIFSEKQCNDPNSKCKSIKDCPSFLATIHGTKKEKQYLKENLCGFLKKVPKVCCPSLPPSVTKKCTARALPDFEPNSQCCGVDGMMHRVSGSAPTNIYQYSWLTLIEYIKDEVIYTPCSGSIISNRYVLTAAHCTLYNQFGKPVSVRVGEYDTQTEDDYVGKHTQGNEIKYATDSVKIESITPHPNFISGDIIYKNDIALLRLAYTIEFNDVIRPICLPSINITRQPPSKSLILAGWGSEKKLWKHSPVKRHASIPYKEISICESVFDRKFWNGQICAGGEDGKGDCKGDSGGPLMHFTGLRYEIVGVVSISFSVCGKKPSVYTNVIEYVPWIKNNTYV